MLVLHALALNAHFRFSLDLRCLQLGLLIDLRLLQLGLLLHDLVRVRLRRLRLLWRLFARVKPEFVRILKPGVLNDPRLGVVDVLHRHQLVERTGLYCLCLSLCNLHQHRVLLLFVASAKTDIDSHVVAVAPLLRIVLHVVIAQAKRQLFHAIVCQRLEDAAHGRSNKRLGHDPRHQFHALLAGVHDQRDTAGRLVQAV